MIYPQRIVSNRHALSATLYGEGENTLIAIPPLAEERKGAVRPLYDLATAAAERGWSALLFDYAGTGDSPGDFDNTDWASLQADTKNAIEFARTLRPHGRTTLVAARLGARLALEYAASHPSMIDAICLWEPVWGGQEWFRNLQRRSRFRKGGASINDADIDGYVFSHTLRNDLASLADSLPDVSAPISILSLASHGRAAKAMQTLAASLQATLIPAIPQPFWMETDVFDATELIGQTLALLETGKPVQAGETHAG